MYTNTAKLLQFKKIKEILKEIFPLGPSFKVRSYF